jgi:release factor glutamine methyltransferase
MNLGARSADVSIGSALASARIRLAHLGADAALDAVRLLHEVTGLGRAAQLARAEAPLGLEQRALLEAAVELRASGEPLAYVLGHVGFYGRTFEVTHDVLVPRPESEQLVERVVAFAAQRGASPLRVADVGTGSGVLAISLALELPQAHVLALDASPAALAVAGRNARRHGVEARVRFQACDGFEELRPEACFDVLVANLPYVCTADLAPPPHPTSFEPRLALDGGCDGLVVYRRLLPRAPRHLFGGGAAFLEAGPDTAKPLAALASLAFGPSSRVGIECDLAGHERIVSVALG